jgi:hypothetical protein
MTEAARIPETYDREARLVAKRAAREAKRQANREVWARDPRNSNVRVAEARAIAAPIPAELPPVEATETGSLTQGSRMKAQ